MSPNMFAVRPQAYQIAYGGLVNTRDEKRISLRSSAYWGGGLECEVLFEKLSVVQKFHFIASDVVYLADWRHRPIPLRGTASTRKTFIQNGGFKMFTFSEQPCSDMWNHIRFLSKKSNCKRLLKGEIKSGGIVYYADGSKLDKKVDQISMCINQASEYFIAANQVSINTSPLLLFYGMLSLAKALIVANKLNLFLEDIEYHGLHTRPVNDCLRFYKESPAKWSMELEYAVTNDGVFKHLTDILDDFTFENNSVFTFKDILSVCPEISKIYEKYYGEPSNTLYLYSHKVISESPYQFVLCPGEVDENEIYARIPELQEDFDLAPDILHEQARKLTSRGLNEIPNYMGLFQSPVGGNYMVGGLEYLEGETKKKRYINPAATDYIAMFILSICVRYKQDFWGSVINGERSGVLGLIELYITVIKRRYPNIILDSLFGEPFRYGSPTFYA